MKLNTLIKLVLLSGLSPLLWSAEGLEKPVPLRTPPPEYPLALRRDGTKGLVVVRVAIDAEGKVANCEVSKSTQSEFNEPALRAVRKWRFKPGRRDGVPVESEVMIPIQFAVED